MRRKAPVPFGEGPTEKEKDPNHGHLAGRPTSLCGSRRVRLPPATRQMSGRYGSHEQVTFDFLGFTFKPRAAKRKNETMFTTFSPAISRKAATSIRQQICRMRFHLRSDLSFKYIARMINSRVGAWAAYYGRFCPSESVNVLFHIDRYLVRWARRKYKHLRRAPRRAARSPGRHQACPARTPRALAMGDPATSGCSTSRMTGAR